MIHTLLVALAVIVGLALVAGLALLALVIYVVFQFAGLEDDHGWR